MTCPDRFKDNNIVIFGGTSGIGLFTAIDFVNNGAKTIIVAGRHEWKWDRAKQKIKHFYGEEAVDRGNIVVIEPTIIEYVKCDVRLESNVKNLLEYVQKKYKYFNVYFNNAGVQPTTGDSDGIDITKLNIESSQLDDGSIIYRIPGTKGSPSTPASEYYETPIATSVIGMFYCLKWEMYWAFSQPNVPVSIINTSSRNGVNIPSESRPIYAASKAFIHSLTQTIATQAAQRSIKENRSVRINCIAPGPIMTPLEIPLFVNKTNVFEDLTNREFQLFNENGSVGVPMGRTGFAREITPAVLFLSDPRQSAYMTGSTMTIDGGYTASPVI